MPSLSVGLYKPTYLAFCQVKRCFDVVFRRYTAHAYTAHVAPVSVSTHVTANVIATPVVTSRGKETTDYVPLPVEFVRRIMFLTKFGIIFCYACSTEIALKATIKFKVSTM